MLSISCNGKICFDMQNLSSLSYIKDEITKRLGISSTDYYLLSNGKIVNETDNLEECSVHIVPRLVGGKGGFGSMLRAIGAQIEKTTNREACRDLSGRRLRDINEEKRLKNWIAQQADREKLADDRRQKKLERLCHKPKHVFKDEEYDQERSALPEKVEDALEQGLKASCSSESGKRKQTEIKTQKKKPRLWLGSDEELSSSSDIDTDDENKPSSPKDSDSTQSIKGTDGTPQISETNSVDNSSDEIDNSLPKISELESSQEETVEIDRKDEIKELKI